MKSDAYHEAGHAVIGVLLKFTLVYVSGDATKGDPHCKWTPHGIQHVDITSSQDEISECDRRTRAYALMCLASEFSEALVSDVNNMETIEALHLDYLLAEHIRMSCGLYFFGLNQKTQLRLEAKALVEQNKDGIGRVAEALMAGRVLTHDQVEALIAKPKE
jgi:hypothetical protein